MDCIRDQISFKRMILSHGTSANIVYSSLEVYRPKYIRKTSLLPLSHRLVSKLNAGI